MGKALNTTPRRQIEELGAGVFIRDRNIESRLAETDFHRAYSEPVIIWISPRKYKEEKMPALFDSARKLFSIQCFRFPNSEVSDVVIDRIRSDFPNARIEGMRTKGPSTHRSQRGAGAPRG